MSVLILDAKDDLEMKYGIELSSQIGMYELLYADDTLLIDIHGISLQKYMDCIADQGLAYGMQFNWDKLEILAVNASVEILGKNNVPIKCKSSIKYLGSILSADGHISSELSRRIGMASQDFKNLSKCWSHIRITKWVKFDILRTLIVSKLLYGLDTAWLNKYDRNRLDEFFANCCRKILGIPHSYISRISNQEVLQELHAIPLSRTLLERQLMLFHKIACEPEFSPLRRLIFDEGLNLKKHSKRSRGRPRNIWTKQIHDHAMEICTQNGINDLGDKDEWKICVRKYCRRTDLSF